MAVISELDKKDIDRMSIKTFQDGTEIRFKLGSGLKNGTRDFYQVAYFIDNKAICLSDQDILEYCKRLSSFNDVDILIDTLYKIYRHDIQDMSELSNCDIYSLVKDIQNMEIVINQSKEVMTNVPISEKDKIVDKMICNLLIKDSLLINKIVFCTKNKIDKIVDSANIVSIDCIAEIKDMYISKDNIVGRLFGELKFCHKKFFHYLYAVFLSEDIYLRYGTLPSIYERKLKMSALLYVLKEGMEIGNAAKQFHDGIGKDIDERLKIISKYDKSQMDIESAWRI